VWSEETIKSYKDYMKSIGGQDSSSMWQQSGTSEDSVKSFISTGTWKWSEKVIKMFKLYVINEPSGGPMSVPEGKTFDEYLIDVQKQCPEEWIVTFMGTGTTYTQIAGLSQIAYAKKIGMCNFDPSGNSIGNGLYKLDSSGKISTDLIDNKDLPTLIPGFTFLNEVCNPCSTDFNCPFALPDNTGHPLLPGLGTEYYWGTSFASAMSTGLPTGLPDTSGITSGITSGLPDTSGITSGITSGLTDTSGITSGLPDTSGITS
jgi:hypothetical protein